MKYQRSDTAVVFTDPQIDVLSEKGIAWGLVVPVCEVLSSHAVVWMLYCAGPGWVLHAVGVVHSPWKRLSGVRFSWMTRMICWKEEIWA